MGLLLTSGGLNFLASKVICGGYEPVVEAAAMAGSSVLSLRAATIDTTSLKEWCNSEYKSFELDNDEKIAKTTPTLEGTLNLCCRVLHATKQAFKLLLDKVNEVNDEVVNIQDTYTTVDEVNNVLAENYALKSDIPDKVDLSGYALKSDYQTLKTENVEFLFSDQKMVMQSIDIEKNEEIKNISKNITNEKDYWNNYREHIPPEYWIQFWLSGSTILW